MSLAESAVYEIADPSRLDPNLVRDEVRALVSKYMQAISAANKEPLLSVRSFFAF
jgi:hypothetical protein